MVASKTSIPEMGELTVAKRGYYTLTEVDFGGDDLAPLLISQFLCEPTRRHGESKGTHTTRLSRR